MSENENKNVNECDLSCCEACKEAEKEKTLTLYDFFMGIFYAVIIFVGISLCIERGLNANIMHLVVVTISLVCISALKFAKFRKELRSHIPEVVFPTILSALALFATFAIILF